MARFRVGPVRFGGGRRPSVTFGVGPFGATFGGGWHRSGGREASGSGGDWSGSSGEWSGTFSQRIELTPWDHLDSLARRLQGVAEGLRAYLWGYVMFMGTLYWILYWQGFTTTFAQSLKDMAGLVVVLGLVNFVYSRAVVPRLQRQLKFVSSQRFAYYLVGWLALTIAITVFWIIVPGDKYALWVLSYVLLGWTFIRQVYLRNIRAFEKEVRDRYQELSSSGPVTSGYNRNIDSASSFRNNIENALSASFIRNNIENALQECAWVTETFQASNYLTRSAWRSPRTAKK